MRVVVERGAADLSRAIADGQRADYVYSYPPRQTYTPLDLKREEIQRLMSQSLARSADLNVYVHFPFCAQICSFCNLYSTTVTGKSPIDDYLDAITGEIESRAADMRGKTVRSVYLGGGTPSLLDARQLERVLDALRDTIGAFGLTIEVALEVDPATVDRTRLSDFRSVGVNRINLGYQSTHDAEVRAMGRQPVAARSVALIADAMDQGFANVCVDLIYGLEGQSLSSWREAVRQVIDIRPQTICAYCLTPRPFTPYWQRGYHGPDGPTTYERYAAANELLQTAGYTQETHVRWVINGGGYQQKHNHWAMENIIGFGAGARSYLWDIETRNGYSVRHRQRPLAAYIRAARSGEWTPSQGFIMNDDERRRKAVILGLMDLNRTWFRGLLGVDPIEEFASEFRCLETMDLIGVSRGRAALTASGRMYRDLIAQLFFSSEVRFRLRRFAYDE